MDVDLTSTLSHFEHPFFNASLTFQRLLVLNQGFYRLRGEAPYSASTMQSQHNRAPNPNNPSPPHRGGPCRNQAFRFLDLDYAGGPSSFAASLLRTDESAHGVGISLRADTSVRVRVDPRVHARFQGPQRDEDVCRIADEQATSGKHGLLYDRHSSTRVL